MISMKMARNLIIGLIILIAVSPANADSFYRGKRIEMIISTVPGGGFDLYGRAFAKYLPDHLDGTPSVVIKNVFGAGGLVGMKYSLINGKTDGTHINLGMSRPVIQYILDVNRDIDPNSLNWIGSLNSDTYIFLADSQKLKNINALRSLQQSFIIGSINSESDSALTARLFTSILNVKPKIVNGYAGNPDILLALERHEIDGAVVSHTAVITKKKEWLDGSDRIVAIFNTKDQIVDGIPSVMNIASNDNDKKLIEFVYSFYEFGRPLFTLPNTPKERILELRKAFQDTVNDPGYIEELKRMKIENRPVSGESIEKLISVLNSSNDIRQRAKIVFEAEEK